MISAIDRHLGFSGGESVALLAVLGLIGWLAYPHLHAAQALVEHARIIAERLSTHVVADLSS